MRTAVDILRALPLAFLLLPFAAGAADVGRELSVLAERANPGQRIEVSFPARTPAGTCALPPALPPGVRLWGRTTVPVRCEEGARLAFVPVDIKVFGKALVAARALPEGAVLHAGDLHHQEVDLARFAPHAIAEPAQIHGRVLTRAIPAGEPVLAAWLRTPPVIAAGDPVKLVYAGVGPATSAEGRALSQAADGQPVRVQTDSGKTLSGVARPGRIVELSRP